MRKALHLLGSLNDTDVQWLIKEGQVSQLSARTTLVREGGELTMLYILLEGELEVVVGESPATSVATLRAGEIVGEMSFVSSRLPSASVIAGTGVTVLSIARAKLLAHMRDEPPFGARFYHAVASFLADRLFVSVGRLGYGRVTQDVNPYALPDDALTAVDEAAARFDLLLRSCLGFAPS